MPGCLLPKLRCPLRLRLLRLRSRRLRSRRLRLWRLRLRSGRLCSQRLRSQRLRLRRLPLLLPAPGPHGDVQPPPLITSLQNAVAHFDQFPDLRATRKLSSFLLFGGMQLKQCSSATESNSSDLHLQQSNVHNAVAESLASP